MNQPSISDTRPRVFVTQEVPNLDFRPAEEFGDIVFLTRYDFSTIRASMHNDALRDEVWSKLKHFDPARDFVCFAGSPAVAAYVFYAIGQQVGDRGLAAPIQLLKWSNRDHRYSVIPLTK